MNGMECTICKMVLNLVSNNAVSSLFIHLTSAYKYIGMLV
jgi:hypothetical protein